MAAPGLFPEGEARAPRLGTFLPLLLFLVLVSLAVVYGIWAHMRTRELEEELAASRMQIEHMGAKAAETHFLARKIQRLQEEIAGISERSRPAEEPERKPRERTEAAPPAPSTLPTASPDEAQARLREGLEAFTAGRYAEAQVHFFRALPDGLVPLALASLARGDLKDALYYLMRAMEADPRWLQRYLPGELFGSAEEYARVLGEVEARVRENPLDPEAKLLLAFLHYHEKGAPYARALLTEITQAHPDEAGARRFLETLEK